MSAPLGYQRSLPEITSLNEPFWMATKKHELHLQRCKKCNEYQWYPRACCVHCGSRSIEWRKTSGKGKIYSYTIIMMVVANSPDFGKDIPYAIGLIELEEGPRMYARMDCDPGLVQIETEVEVVFEDVTDQVAIPKFRPIRKSK